MFEIDWSELFIPSQSVLELVVRGSVVYLLLFVVVRFLPRRTIGGLSASDVLVIVLIADAVQEAMAGSYQSITEGLVLAGVIIGWATFIDWLDARFPDWHIAAGGPLAVIRNGRFLHHNMKREHITEDEVLSQLRQYGLNSPRNVETAFVEGDGHITVILRGGLPLHPPPASSPTGSKPA